MTKTVTVLTPVIEQTATRGKLLPRIASLSGLRIGLLDNGKPNVDLLLNQIESVLSERFAIASVVRLHKSRIGFVPEYIDQLASQCDVVINGVAD